MERSTTGSDSIERYRENGGVLEITIFENAKRSLDQHRNGIKEAIEIANERHRLWLERSLGDTKKFEPCWINQEQLAKLPYKSIDISTFHGDWFDCQQQRLIHRGSWRTHDGRELLNPFLTDLDPAKMKGGASNMPGLWQPGEFAYAFANPPYGLRATPQEIESLYLQVCDLILPVGQEGDIYSWNNEQLLAVSNYFEAGAEWWGCFAFTTYDPMKSQLSAVIGSTTD